MKDVVVIGGPNGAGKTTWAVRRLPPTLNIREFVNVDEIARGLSPLDPEGSAAAAGRLMIERLNDLLRAGHTCTCHLPIGPLSMTIRMATALLLPSAMNMSRSPFMIAIVGAESRGRRNDRSRGRRNIREDYSEPQGK